MFTNIVPNHRKLQMKRNTNCCCLKKSFDYENRSYESDEDILSEPGVRTIDCMFSILCVLKIFSKRKQ